MFVVLFDIDGTLVLTGGAGQAAFAGTFLEDFGVPYFPDDVMFAGRSDRAIAEDIMLHHGMETSADNWSQFESCYCDRLQAALPTRQGHVLPGVADLLKELDQLDGVALGLLTGNLERGARAKLAHYDLLDYFAFGGFGDVSRERNDIAAQAVRAARGYLSESNSDGQDAISGVMVLGDTVNDIRCAKSIGAYAVAVATGSTSPAKLASENPHLLLNDLVDASHIYSHIQSTNHSDQDLAPRH